MPRENYSILRKKSSEELIPISKLDSITDKIGVTIKYIYNKHFKEQYELNKIAKKEKEHYNKTVVLRKFIIDTLKELNEAKVIVIQVDNTFLTVLDDVINGTLELKDYMITPIKMNTNYKKYIKNPHILLQITYKGGVIFD